MIESLSTPRNRMVSLILLMICGMLAIAAAFLGVDDNLPGILLAFLAATAFVLAFVHPWQTARKFMLLLLASVIGFVLFVILNIFLDSVIQNPSASVALKNLIQSPTTEVMFVIMAMLCTAALVVGPVGSIVMFIRSRRQ